jgi:hypothetical protein
MHTESVISKEGILRQYELYNLVEDDLPVLVHLDEAGNDTDVSAVNEQPMERSGNETSHFMSRMTAMSDALDGSSVRYNDSVVHFDSSDVHWTDQLGSSSPISIVGHDSALNNPGIAVAEPMTQVEMEAAVYGWRYPSLYDAMVAAAGREDLAMTAVRLLEEEEEKSINHLKKQNGGGSEGFKYSRTYLEAKMFVEEELSRRQ